jgi:hypothetical protein
MKPTTAAEAETVLARVRGMRQDILGLAYDPGARAAVVAACRQRLIAEASEERILQWTAAVAAAVYAQDDPEALRQEIARVRGARQDPDILRIVEVVEFLVTSGAPLGGSAVLARIKRVGDQDEREAHAKAVAGLAGSPRHGAGSRRGRSEPFEVRPWTQLHFHRARGA